MPFRQIAQRTPCGGEILGRNVQLGLQQARVFVIRAQRQQLFKAFKPLGRRFIGRDFGIGRSQVGMSYNFV